MNCSLRKQIQSLKTRLSSFKRPRWFQWSLTPKAGNPPTLSVLEFTVYLALAIVGFWLFANFNEIQHKSIFIEADRLSDYRYIEKATQPWANDSTFFLHYERANINLRIPMTFAIKQDQGELTSTLQIYSDSIPLKCTEVLNPLPDIISTRLMNLTPISKYWNIVFERATRDNGMLPAPNKLVDYQTSITNPNYSAYYETRDLFNKVSSHSKMKMMDSCKQQLIENLLPDVLSDKELVSSYRLCQKVQHLGRYKKKEKFISKPIVCEKCNRCVGANYSIHNHYEHKPLFIIDSYTAIVADKHHADNFPKNGEAEFVHLFGNKPGWFTLHDISQGYYDINLQTASIDSLNLTIDFVGAVTLWTSIEPDVMNVTSISYTDPIKILKIRNEGLHLYYESKELASKQTIRVFVLSAMLSGLVIILITFLILGSHRGLLTLRKYRQRQSQ